jgi:hypothetical protein
LTRWPVARKFAVYVNLLCGRFPQDSFAAFNKVNRSQYSQESNVIETGITDRKMYSINVLYIIPYEYAILHFLISK